MYRYRFATIDLTDPDTDVANLMEVEHLLKPEDIFSYVDVKIIDAETALLVYKQQPKQEFGPQSQLEGLI